jgi:hypothetical protein
MNSNTNIFYEQQLLAMKLADVFNTEVKKKLKTILKKKCILPTTDTIYSKDIVLEQEGDYKYYGNYETSGSKYKKQYDGYYDYNSNRYDSNNDYYGNEDDSENSLTREYSEKLSHKGRHFETDKTNKFISKSKSPIVSKKKLSNLDSLSPGHKKNSDSEKGKSKENVNNITPFENRRKLFCISEKSRFDFVKNADNNEAVPEFVSDVISKKCSRYSFFNKFASEFEKDLNDCEYFEKKLKKDHSWSEFILKNMENK